ncbi:MAG TPA: serine hydrolase, partial [Prosthecobacter sp.]|nr:serine hydrolase [Prosthecobacter sp.]
MPPPDSSRRREFLRLLLAGSGCAVGGDLLAAEAKGDLPEERLKAAGSYSAKHGGSGLLVKQHGKVIFEDYGKSGGKGTARRIYSGTKAFWCLAALAAAEDDVLNLDEQVAETITEWKDVRGKNRITINQLLHLTGGLERGLKIHQDGLTDRNAMALARPLVAGPGEAFIYGPSQLQVFHEVLKRKLARL